MKQAYGNWSEHHRNKALLQIDFKMSGIVLIGLLVLSACGVKQSTDSTENCSINISSASTGEESILGSSATGGDELAQSIYLTEDLTISSIDLMLKPLGSPSGNLTVSIQGNSGGNDNNTNLPDGVDLIISNSVSASDIIADQGSTSASNYEGIFHTFHLPSSIKLTKDSRYWVRLKASYSLSTTNAILWSANTQNTYAGGVAIYETSTPGNWLRYSSQGKDFLLKLGCQ